MQVKETKNQNGLSACLPGEFRFAKGTTCVPHSTKGTLSHFNQKGPSIPIRPMEPSCLYQKSPICLPAHVPEVPVAHPPHKPQPLDSVAQASKQKKKYRPQNKKENRPRKRAHFTYQIVRISGTQCGGFGVGASQAIYQFLASYRNIQRTPISMYAIKEHFSNSNLLELVGQQFGTCWLPKKITSSFKQC